MRPEDRCSILGTALLPTLSRVIGFFQGLAPDQCWQRLPVSSCNRQLTVIWSALFPGFAEFARAR